MMSKRKLQSLIITLIFTLGLIAYNKLHSWLNSNTNNQPKIEQHQSKTNKKEISSSSLITDIDEWSYEKYPNYYSVIGKAQIDDAKFNNLKENLTNPKFESAITYTGKDSLNRTQAVYAIITLKAIQKSSAEKRHNFQQNDTPSGWTKNEQVKVETTSGMYSGWFWNKSHLVADRLGGKATSDNAITGTRMQNVGNRSNSGGMYYIEEKTVNYLRTHRTNHVYYVATPIYNNDELIPRYVVVDAKSNDGVLDECVITYNYQNGYTIDYLNGGFIKN